MIGDVNYPKSVLNLHFYGDNDGTIFTDTSSSAKTITAVNGAKTITSVADPFGASNGIGYFDGINDHITLIDSTDWDLSGDFLIRCRFYLTGYSSVYGGSLYGGTIVGNYIAGQGWQLRINGTASSYTTINLYTGTTDLNFTISGGVALNTWYDLEVSRASGSIRAFVNGAQQGSTVTNSDNFTSTTTSPLMIGKLNDATYVFPWKGYLSDLQIYKDVAGHTSNFTLSSVPFIDYAGQLTGNITESSYSYISKWLVRAWKSFSASAYKEYIATGTTYSLDLPTLDPYVLACAPYIDGKWESGKTVTAGQFIVTSNPETTPYLWEVTTGGNFDTVEATWNLSGTTTQGTAILTFVGLLPSPSILGPKIPS